MSVLQVERETKDKPETIRTINCCYLSTPQHLRSFIGVFIYIYTARGRLCLTSESLTFTSKKKTLEISTAAITDVSIGHYSRLAKPIRLDYMAVTINEKGSDKTVFFTPTKSPWLPVWKTNEIVASWMSSISQVIANR